MTRELDDVKSRLVEFRQEMSQIKTIYGNEEIRILLKRSEDARHEIDSIKSQIESILPVARSVLSEIITGKEFVVSKPEASTTYDEPSEYMDSRLDLKSTKSSYEKEIGTLATRYDETRSSLERLNSEYATRVEELQTTRSEILLLKTQRESASRELDKSRSEIESIKFSQESNEIQLMRKEIEDTRQEVSDIIQEKNRVTYELDNIDSKIKSKSSELAQVLADIDDVKDRLERKNYDISTAKRELEFIDREMVRVHEKDEIQKLTKASAKLVEEANKRYMDAEKELHTLRGIIEKKIQPEYIASEGA
jgi:chromosome segregation ATPase